MKRTKAVLSQGLSILIIGSLALSLLSGCTGVFNGKLFKERAAETPAPDDYASDKSFWVDPSGKPKTFLCAWAPEIGRGSEAYLEPYVNNAPHCNVEFEITENNLIGKVVNPSFPDDRSRWKEMLQIPITKHYYYEKDKDAHGRETNQWIENSSRSHWSARPKMKLDLSHIQIFHLTSEDGGVGEAIVAAKDIEWDLANNFLGFSIDTSWRYGDGEQSINYQATYRINFLKFEHDSTFKKVPYHQENSRYVNILHVMGRKVEGIEPELYAAHWDVRHTTRVYISGAPDKQIEDNLVKAVWQWNHELRKVGAVGPDQVAFSPVIKTLDHPFDLRYPSITWIEDRKVSTSAPLGIGMAHADVRNGQILWGGVVLFGGLLEKYINAYAPADASASPTGSSLSPFQALAAMFPAAMPPVKALDPANGMNRTQMLQNLTIDHQSFLTQEIARLAMSKNPGDKSEQAALKVQLQNLQSQDPGLNKIIADLNANITEQSAKVGDYFKHMSMQDLLGTAGAKPAPSLVEVAKNSGHPELINAFQQTDSDKRLTMLKSVVHDGSAFFTEEGMTIENLSGSMMASPAQTTRTYPEMLDSVVSSLIIHEFGHFIGLGHQFKENIVPEVGTVPSRFITDLAAKATKEKEFTNFSSVMGYQSGQTEMMTPAE